MNNEKNNNLSLFEGIDSHSKFYEHISDSIWSMPTSPHALGNLSSSIFTSTSNTIKTIKYTIENNHFSDSYVLVGKVYENILTFLYIELETEEQFDNEQIKNWISGKKKLHNLTMKELIKYFNANEKISECFSVLKIEGVYKNLKSDCNNYVHNNFMKNVVLNSVFHFNPQTIMHHQKRIINYLDSIHSLAFAIICVLKPYYAKSSDYMDHLEMGMTPPEDSQYWVAPFMQEEFEKLNKSNPELAKLILKHSYMQFKEDVDEL